MKLADVGVLAIVIGTQAFLLVVNRIFGYQHGLDPSLVPVSVPIFLVFQACLMLLVPGRAYQGPPAPGETVTVPVYRDNGFRCFLLTMAATVATYGSGIASATQFYEHLGNTIGFLNIFGVLFCAVLYVKAWLFSPESWALSRHLPWLRSFYDGVETYPLVGPLNLKFWTNCRVGMMGWPALLLIYWSAQVDYHGQAKRAMLVSVLLQLIYIAKFFWWESGYAYSMDIQHDRAGYYICWGCLVWVPLFYSIHTAWLVEAPGDLDWWTSMCLFLCGALAIKVNYDADRQRQLVRSKGPLCKIWGETPRVIVARIGDGTKRSVLLCSGYWGLARHFHYVPEIIAAFCWCIPAAAGGRPVDLFFGLAYPLYLTILLVHRSWRDEEKCWKKYGRYWDQYRQLVPYRILPGVY